MAGLERWRGKYQIKRALVDFDDTLCDTSELMLGFMAAYVRAMIGYLPQLQYQEVWDELCRVNDESYVTHHVEPERWRDIAAVTGRKFGEEQLFKSQSDVLMQIFKTAPPLFDGAVDTLDAFRQVGCPVTIVTHASEDWTKVKIRDLGLDGRFDDLVLADVTKAKSKLDYKRAMDRAGVAADRCVVVGDSLKGDIIAAFELGVRERVWIETDWVIHKAYQVPEGTTVVKGIGEVVQALSDKAQ